MQCARLNEGMITETRGIADIRHLSVDIEGSVALMRAGETIHNYAIGDARMAWLPLPFAGRRQS